MRTIDATLSEIVGARRVLLRPSALVAYTSDGLPGYHRTPSLAVFPGTRDELMLSCVFWRAKVCRSCREVPAQD